MEQKSKAGRREPWYGTSWKMRLRAYRFVTQALMKTLRSAVGWLLFTIICICCCMAVDDTRQNTDWLSKSMMGSPGKQAKAIIRIANEQSTVILMEFIFLIGTCWGIWKFIKVILNERYMSRFIIDDPKHDTDESADSYAKAMAKMLMVNGAVDRIEHLSNPRNSTMRWSHLTNVRLDGIAGEYSFDIQARRGSLAHTVLALAERRLMQDDLRVSSGDIGGLLTAKYVHRAGQDKRENPKPLKDPRFPYNSERMTGLVRFLNDLRIVNHKAYDTAQQISDLIDSQEHVQQDTLEKVARCVTRDGTYWNAYTIHLSDMFDYSFIDENVAIGPRKPEDA